MNTNAIKFDVCLSTKDAITANLTEAGFFKAVYTPELSALLTPEERVHLCEHIEVRRILNVRFWSSDVQASARAVKEALSASLEVIKAKREAEAIKEAEEAAKLAAEREADLFKFRALLRAHPITSSTITMYVDNSRMHVHEVEQALDRGRPFRPTPVLTWPEFATLKPIAEMAWAAAVAERAERRARIEQEVAAREARTARRLEEENAERAEWINKHGSEELKRALKEGYEIDHECNLQAVKLFADYFKKAEEGEASLVVIEQGTKVWNTFTWEARPAPDAHAFAKFDDLDSYMQQYPSLLPSFLRHELGVISRVSVDNEVHYTGVPLYFNCAPHNIAIILHADSKAPAYTIDDEIDNFDNFDR